MGQAWEPGALSLRWGLARRCLGPSSHPAHCTGPGAGMGQPPVSREGDNGDASADLLAPSLTPDWIPLLLPTAQGFALFFFFNCVWSQVFSRLACRFTGDQSTQKEVSRQAGVRSAGHPGWTMVRWGALKLREMRNLSEFRFSFLYFSSQAYSRHVEYGRHLTKLHKHPNLQWAGVTARTNYLRESFWEMASKPSPQDLTLAFQMSAWGLSGNPKCYWKSLRNGCRFF